MSAAEGWWWAKPGLPSRAEQAGNSFCLLACGIVQRCGCFCLLWLSAEVLIASLAAIFLWVALFPSSLPAFRGAVSIIYSISFSLKLLRCVSTI